MNYDVDLIASSAINIVMLLILLYLIFNNTVMSSKTMKAYIIVTIMTIIIIIAEIATNIFDLSGSKFRTYNIIANIIGFSISPLISVILAVVFDEKLYKKIKYIIIPSILNAAVFILSPWTSWTFSISMNNEYFRGPCFSVYVVTYIFGLIILMISNYNQCAKFQLSEKIFLVILYLIIIIGTTIQVLFPSIHSTWHSISLVLVMYYLFQRELQFKYDVVTNLLNRQEFEKNLKHLKKSENIGVILLDLDNFKKINDTYGHLVGDYCLKISGEIIKKSFSKIGHCYRIGGDEFCVIAPNIEENDINKCIKCMVNDIDDARINDPVMPTISCGYSISTRNASQDILKSVEEADSNMYLCKNMSK